MAKEANLTHDIPNQTELWDRQHSSRGNSGLEATQLRDVPNSSAIDFINKLGHNFRANILEVGSANGRDARYWASLGHNVICVDFSPVALGQLKEIAIRQNVYSHLYPVCYDINTGKLPGTYGLKIDGFYSRSSLHVDDDKIFTIAQDINNTVEPEGLILIEGKGEKDKKIQRSKTIGKHLVIDPDEGGHIRRVWTRESLVELCDKFNWDIKSLEDRVEYYNGNPINFVRLVARKP